MHITAAFHFALCTSLCRPGMFCFFSSPGKVGMRIFSLLFSVSLISWVNFHFTTQSWSSPTGSCIMYGNYSDRSSLGWSSKQSVRNDRRLMQFWTYDACQLKMEIVICRACQLSSINIAILCHFWHYWLDFSFLIQYLKETISVAILIE